MSVYYSNITRNVLLNAVCLYSVQLGFSNFVILSAAKIMYNFYAISPLRHIYIYIRHMFTAHGCALFLSARYNQTHCGRSGGLRRARTDANGPAEIYYEPILQIH